MLLQAARCAIEAAVCCRPEELSATTYPPPLLKPCGAFVTIHHKDDLRGCIGYIESAMALVDTVREVGAKAALDDFRFEPVGEDELPEITIEISVLSPLHPMIDSSEIKIGTHGLMVEFKRARGLLLPQVAVEYGWDAELFLVQTARKAGLPPTMWSDPEAKVYLFTAEVFRESCPHGNNRKIGKGTATV